MTPIPLGAWVRVGSEHHKIYGLVVSASSNGICRTLVVRPDLGGPDVRVAELWVERAQPPRSAPRLACVDGVQV